jgi:hypothetical protein
MERKIEEAGATVLLGAVVTSVGVGHRRVQHIDFATRFGPVRVEANGYVDASGDASLTYEAGLDVREPDAPVYGSLNFLIEGRYSSVNNLAIKDVHQRLATHGAAATSSGMTAS